MTRHILRPAIVAAAALAITGCTSTGSHGYAGLSYGYARPYAYYGWYRDYYYPGAGYYIYDRHGTRYRWNDDQRHYWESRRGSGHRVENWSGYRHDRDRDDHDRRDRR